eukprot:COSAG04_NODE_1020_length_8729_cov_2.983082_1_plen_173_part_10
MASGYTTTTAEGELTVVELGTVDCATGWTNTTAVPSATCVRQMSEPVQDFEFVLSGCAEKACTAPGQTTVTNAEGDYSVAAPDATVASELTLSCGPSSDGTASAVCLTEGGAFQYSGCEWRTCAALNEEVATGYSVAEPSGTTVGALGTVSCAAGHEPAGVPSATCAETNGTF